MSTRKAKADSADPSKKAPRSKPKVAAEEVSETPPDRKVEWHGITFTLPPQLPEAAILDLAVAETSLNPTASYKLLKRVLGEEQFAIIVNRVDNDDDVDLSDVAELLGAVFREYGTSEGE